MNARDYDEAYDHALDSGLCSEGAADYAYDVWRGQASPPVVYPNPVEVAYAQEHGFELPPARRVSDGWLEATYGDRCER